MAQKYERACTGLPIQNGPGWGNLPMLGLNKNAKDVRITAISHIDPICVIPVARHLYELELIFL